MGELKIFKGFRLKLCIILLLFSLILNICPLSATYTYAEKNTNGLDLTEINQSNNVALNNNQLIESPLDINSWPMFHKDLENTGYSNSNAPDSDIQKWSFYLGDSVSSPIVVNGNVYVGQSTDKFYCINADTGDELWSYISDSGMYFSAPAFYDEKVYFQITNELICLNANNGGFIWSYSPCGGWSSPAVSDGKIYFGSDNNNVYCLNAYTGDMIWNYETGDRVKSSPAIEEGRLYIGSDDSYLYCLDANSGDEIWKFSTGGQIQSSPAVSNGKVYIGSADGYMYCIDINDGEEIWSYAPCCVKISSPAIAYGKVYAGTTCDASLYCLDAETGDKIWHFQTGGHIWSAPAVADGKVYFGSLDSKIYCLFAETGSEIWNRLTPGNIITSPAIAGEDLFIGSNDGKLYCFTSDNQAPVPIFDWEPENPQTGEEITFDASYSYDTDGTIELYEWDWESDGTYDESNIEPFTIHTYYVEDLYLVTLRVTDDDGETDTITKNVYVGVEPPVADFFWTPEIPEADENVIFDASDSYDTDGTIILFEWDWDDDGTYDESNTIPTAENTWSDEGSYPVQLRVTDDDGLTSICRKNIHIGVIPPIADFDWSPQVPQSGKVVTFDASDSYDPDGIIEQYEWDWDDDGEYDVSTTSPIIQHTWFEAGDYPITLKVTDNSEAYDTETKNIHVFNRPPIGKFEWTPEYPFPDQTITFDASDSYDPDGFIVSYEWDWDGDGIFDEYLTEPTTAYSWGEKGSYEIELRVIDNSGKKGRIKNTIDVTGEIITNANWGDCNYSGSPPGQYLSYKLNQWNGFDITRNKALSQVDINVWIPIFRKNIENRFFRTNILHRIREINFPIIDRFFNILKNIFTNKIQNNNFHSIKNLDIAPIKGGGRSGLAWGSIGTNYIATSSGDAQISIQGSLKGKFSTDELTNPTVDNWVTVNLHIVEKDSYIPDENEGEIHNLYYYNFTNDKKIIDVNFGKSIIVNLTKDTEYLIYLKLKCYTSLSPKRPIIDGFFSSSAFGKQPSDINGAEFEYIGIQYF